MSTDYRSEEDDESGTRFTWEVLTWIVVTFTLLLNLALILILLIRRNISTPVNKCILAIAVLDLFYGMLVSPFFVENYVHLNWEQSSSFCGFYIYFFTFHDMIVPGILVLLCSYVAFRFAGIMEEFKHRRIVFIVAIVLIVLFSFLFAIPATVYSDIFREDSTNGGFKEECRTWDSFTMLLSYCLASSLLFSFTMSFLFSLCILGSPFFKSIGRKEEFTQRFKLVLSLCLVNIFYIITGFLLNFKEISRLLYSCCDIKNPYEGINTLTYDVWSFTFLAMEPLLRPLTYFIFYFKYLQKDYLVY